MKEKEIKGKKETHLPTYSRRGSCCRIEANHKDLSSKALKSPEDRWDNRRKVKI